MTIKYNEWHLRDAEASAALLKVDTARGLDEKEVQRRRRKNGRNTIWYIRRSRGAEYAASAAGDLISFLLIIAAVTAAVFEGSEAARSVCAILAAGMLIRTLTYVKARRILEELADEGIPSATVLRSGTVQVLRADELVEGDVILLGPGDIVPCDGRIFSGDGVKVIEKGVTENSSTVVKGDTVILTDSGKDVPCEFRVNMLFAGSTVIAGKCRIIATACGEDALVSMKYGGLLLPSGEKLPVTEALVKWSRASRLVFLGLVIFISVLSLFTMSGDSFGFAGAFTDAVALAASSSAGYLFLSGYITLTIPLRRIARGDCGIRGGKRDEKRKWNPLPNVKRSTIGHGAASVRSIIRNAADVESVAGTELLVATDASVFKSGRSIYSSYYKDGELHAAEPGNINAENLLSIALTSVRSGSSGATLFSGGGSEKRDKQVLLENSSEEFGMRAVEPTKQGSHYSSSNENGGFVKGVRTNTSSVVEYRREDGPSGDIDTVLLVQESALTAQVSGDVRTILSYCDSIIVNGREIFLSYEERARIISAADKIEASGGIAIALAERESPYNSLRRLSVIHSKMRFLGFAAFDEKAENGLEEAARMLKGSGKRVVLLSSNPVREKRYLEKRGIYDGSEKIVSCKDLIRGVIPEGSFIVWTPASGSDSGSVDAALKMRTAIVRKLADSIPGICVITSEPSEAAMMAKGTVGAAVSRSRNRPIPQTLKRRAKISIYPSAEYEEGYGGFFGAVKAIAASTLALENLRRTAIFTLMSQSVRIACTLLCVIFGGKISITAAILFSGMILDFLSVLAISFRAKQDEVLVGDASEREIPDLRQSIRRSGIGLLIGCAEFGFARLVGTLFRSSDGETSAVLAVVMFLTQAIFLIFTVSGLNKKSLADSAGYPIVLAASALAVVLIAASASAASFFGVESLPWPQLLVSLIFPAVSAIATVCWKKFKIKRRPSAY